VCGIANGKWRLFETSQWGTYDLTIDEDADFTELVQRQWRFVFRVAYAVLLNTYDAEDAAQETFLKLYRNSGWRNLENERAFLARVAWRMAVDRRHRTQQPNANVLRTSETSARTADPPSPDIGPEQTLILTDQNNLIHSLIDALPEDLRVPLVLSANDELNSREIGRVLNIPEGTVRTRLQRARQLLRQKLEAVRQSSCSSPRTEEAFNG
jgi:RNA polymerase sigma-70 factor, ECF subfamily